MDIPHSEQDNLIPLWQWAIHDHSTPPLTDKGRAIDAEALLQRAAQWHRTLALSSHSRVAVYHTDLFEFLAILMAVWSSDSTACIPGDACEVTQARLHQVVNRFVGSFSEHPSASPDDQGNLQAASNASDTAVKRLWHPEYPAIEIYTSGSTGAPKPIQKTLGQLFDEITALETLWPTNAGTTVLGSVSHHHFYGLMFRVLWPLVSKRPIERSMCTFTEDIFQWSGLYDRYHLISSPTHLSRINPELDWSARAGQCTMIVSAAAPLKRADSLSAKKHLGSAVHEIYGSSETGAIAWRVQDETLPDQAWQPTPGSQIDQESDGRLRVRAPFIREGVLTLADQIQFCDEEQRHFTLQGRADRIVKLEGKRISLSAIERTLAAQPEIAEVKALILKRKRDEIAIVAELTSNGLAKHQQLSRRAFTQHLMRALIDQFEAVARPRRWRFVTSMPTNEQGKITQNALEALFDSDSDTNANANPERPTQEALNVTDSETPMWPVVTDKDVHPPSVTLNLTIPEDLIYFEGHFEGNPVLPGVVQTHWAEHYGRSELGVTGAFSHLEVIKFQRIIAPKATLTLSLEFNADKQKLTFSYRSDEGEHSSGRICYAS